MIINLKENDVEEMVERTCFKCKTKLYFHEFYGSNEYLGIDRAIELWQSSLIEFFCCSCYSNKMIKATKARLHKNEYNALIRIEQILGEELYPLRDDDDYDDPEDLGYFRVVDNSIIGLDLSYEGLRQLPVEIKYFPKLESLNISVNHLTYLPEWIGDLTSVSRLEAYENHIFRIPDSIGCLSSLKFLVLSFNRITKLPESIGNLNLLKELILRGNYLKNIPESITNLTSLKTLILQNNRLIEFPETISSLKSLIFINLRENNLTDLPESLLDIDTLKYIELRNNTIKKGNKILRKLKERGVKVII